MPNIIQKLEKLKLENLKELRINNYLYKEVSI